MRWIGIQIRLQVLFPSLHRHISHFSMLSSDEVISLADLMRRHRDLLVYPLLWNSHYLERTECRFQHVDNATPTEDTGNEQ